MTDHDLALVERVATEVVPHLASGCTAKPPQQCGTCDCFGQIPAVAGDIARAVLDAIAAQPAPVADRDALAEGLHRTIVDQQPGHADWQDCAKSGPCGEDADALLASGVVQDAADVRAQERREVAEEIAAAIEMYRERLVERTCRGALTHAANLVREHASDRKAER